MNKALYIKNWNKGGNSYVLKGNPKNKWVGFQESVITQLSNKFEDFNIVIWTDREMEDDYYCIPFSSLRHLFTKEHQTTGKYQNRWTAIIINHSFQMHSNKNYAVDVSKYYSAELLKENRLILDEDYFIENARAEINIRIGQSKFRKSVLSNFYNKCALTGISEKNLLVASHIIPWSLNKNVRGDVTNGIALYCEIDKLFDQGYISFSNDFKVILSPKIKNLSEQLRNKIEPLNNLPLQPSRKQPNIEFLEFHRKNILQ
ncbi:MAG: HNH endonuclease [Bacteroidota bacterium]|nr:HNH endonuclease [Bacteroidota bacterium]MEC8683504.1 HNH endonuclease [Bacteroidota bacterium]MEE3146921.1 HNH endonuclease [Bacteroidota bacterium]